MTHKNPTPTKRTVFIVTTALLLLSALGIAGVAGTAAAQSANTTDAPEYNLEFDGEGTYAFGSPGVTEQTMTDVFDEDMTGFDGSVYAFDESEQRWNRVSDASDIEVDALSAYVVVVEEGENAGATIRFEQTDSKEPPATRNLTGDGWNFVTASRNGEAVNDTASGEGGFATNTPTDQITVLDQFSQPTASPGTEGSFPGDDEATAVDAVTVDPFTGYFLFSEEGALFTAVDSNATQSEANSALDVEQLRTNISHSIELGSSPAAVLADDEEVTVEINSTNGEGESVTTTATLNGSNSSINAVTEDALFGAYETDVSVNAADVAEPVDYTAEGSAQEFDVEETGGVSGPAFTVRFNSTISGEVINDTGDGVADATVNITNASSGEAVRTITTNSTTDPGAYETTLPSGTYNVTVDKSGFAEITNSSITVTPGESKVVNFDLQPATINGAVELEATAPAPQPANGLEVDIRLENDSGTQVATETVTIFNSGDSASYSFDVDPANFSGAGGNSAVFADINRDNVSNDEDYSLNTSGIGDDTEAGRELDALAATDVQTENFTVFNAASDLSVTARDATADGSTANVTFNGTLNKDVSATVSLNVSENNLTASNISSVTTTTAGANSPALTPTDLLRGDNEINTTSSGEFAFAVEFASGVVASEEFEAELVDSQRRVSEDANATDTFNVDTTVVGADGFESVTAPSVLGDAPVTENYTVTLDESVQANVTLDLNMSEFSANNISNVEVNTGTPETTVNNTTLFDGTAVVKTNRSGNLDLAVTFGEDILKTGGNAQFITSIDSSDQNVTTSKEEYTGIAKIDTVAADAITEVTAPDATATNAQVTQNYTVTLDEAVSANVTVGLVGGNLTAADIVSVSAVNGTEQAGLTPTGLVNRNAVVNTSSQGEIDLGVTFDSSVDKTDVFNASIDAGDSNVDVSDSNETAFSVDTTEEATATVNGTVDIEDAAPDPVNGLEVRIEIRNDNETEVGSQTVNLSSSTSTVDYSFNVDPANFSDSGRDSAVLADINRGNVSNDEDYSLDTFGAIGDDTEAGRKLVELNASETQTENFTVLSAASDLSVTARNATADGSTENVTFNGTLNKNVSATVSLDVTENNITADNINSVTTTTAGDNSPELITNDLIFGDNEINTTSSGEFAFAVEFASGVVATEEFEAELVDSQRRVSEDANATDTFTVDTAGSNVGDNFAGGSGTEADPYQIANWNHLNNTRQNLEANFTLVANLNKSTSGYEIVVLNSNTGFKPVGAETTPFAGTFDGDGNRVADLLINQSQDAPDGTGLFGTVGQEGVIESITLKNASVINATNKNIGALAGRNYGTITESNASVDISGTTEYIGGLVGLNGNTGRIERSHVIGDVSGGPRSGGLAGKNDNIINESSAVVNVSDRYDNGGLVGDNNHLIKQSSAEGTVTGTNVLGGLVGRSDESGTVTKSHAAVTVEITSSIGGTVGGLVGSNYGVVNQSYATGNVTAPKNQAGGLIGNDDGSVANSYATGDVKGNDSVGGLIGYDPSGEVNKTYATGEVNITGSGDVGGLIGAKRFGSVENSYWDINSTGQPTSEGGGTPLSTANMTGTTASNNMDGLDFSAIWEPVTSSTAGADADGYPILQTLDTEQQVDEVEITSPDTTTLGIVAEDDFTYDPSRTTTIGAAYNTTDVINDSDAAIRLVNVTAGNNTEVARNESIPSAGLANTTIPAGNLSGDVTIQTQLFNTSNNTAVANDTVNLTAGVGVESAAPAVGVLRDGRYDPKELTNLTTGHNATGVLDSTEVGVRIRNVTGTNNSVVTSNTSASVPINGEAKHTLPANTLSGNVTLDVELFNASNGTTVANGTFNLTSITKVPAPYLANPADGAYSPNFDTTITTFHNATGVIDSDDVAIRLLNGTNDNDTQIALNDSVDLKGEANTTVPAGNLSGDVTVDIQLFNTSSDTAVANSTLNLTAVADTNPAPYLAEPGNGTYSPEFDHTIGTFHNATGVIDSDDVAIRLLNGTNGNDTQIALNDSVDLKGEANTTVPAGNLSGDVTVDIQLFNTSSDTAVANSTLNLTAVADTNPAPYLAVPDGDTYDPDSPLTIGTDHNATGVIDSSDLAVRYLNATNGNDTEIARNTSVTLIDDVNTTIPAGNLSGDVTIETQLYNTSSGVAELNDTTTLDAVQSGGSSTATVNGTVDIEDAAAAPDSQLEVRIDVQDDSGTTVKSENVTLASNTSTANYNFTVDPANFNGGSSAVLADINRGSVTNDEDYSLPTNATGDGTEEGRDLTELNASESQTENFTVLAAASDASVTATNATANASPASTTLSGNLNENVSEVVELEVTTDSGTLDASNISSVTNNTGSFEAGTFEANVDPSDLTDGTAEIKTDSTGAFSINVEIDSNVTATEEFRVALIDEAERISETTTVTDSFTVDTEPNS